jgi:uncharacterized tellurite resistance protein B-like protein
MAASSAIAEFTRQFRPQNPFSSVMPFRLEEVGVPVVENAVWERAERAIANISYRIDVAPVVRLPDGVQECCVFLREIRQSGADWLFLVEQGIDDVGVVFSARDLAEVCDGIPAMHYINPRARLPFVKRANLWLNQLIGRLTSIDLHYLDDWVQKLGPVASSKHMRLIHKIHILMFLAMEDGFVFEAERKVIRAAIQDALGGNREDLYALTRYTDNCFVTAPAFQASLQALLPMPQEEAEALLQSTKMLIASDGVFTEGEERFLQQLRQILRSAA